MSKAKRKQIYKLEERLEEIGSAYFTLRKIYDISNKAPLDTKLEVTDGPSYIMSATTAHGLAIVIVVGDKYTHEFIWNDEASKVVDGNVYKGFVAHSVSQEEECDHSGRSIGDKHCPDCSLPLY